MMSDGLHVTSENTVGRTRSMWIVGNTCAGSRHQLTHPWPDPRKFTCHTWIYRPVTVFANGNRSVHVGKFKVSTSKTRKNRQFFGRRNWNSPIILLIYWDFCIIGLAAVIHVDCPRRFFFSRCGSKVLCWEPTQRDEQTNSHIDLWGTKN
jgi:hypothetical protein